MSTRVGGSRAAPGEHPLQRTTAQRETQLETRALAGVLGDLRLLDRAHQLDRGRPEGERAEQDLQLHAPRHASRPTHRGPAPGKPSGRATRTTRPGSSNSSGRRRRWRRRAARTRSGRRASGRPSGRPDRRRRPAPSRRWRAARRVGRSGDASSTICRSRRTAVDRVDGGSARRGVPGCPRRRPGPVPARAATRHPRREAAKRVSATRLRAATRAGSVSVCLSRQPVDAEVGQAAAAGAAGELFELAVGGHGARPGASVGAARR